MQYCTQDENLSPDERRLVSAVVDSLFEHEITEQQLRSFDDYIANQCASIIEQNNYVECQSIVNADGAIHRIEFKNVQFGTPCVIERDGETRNINPMQARLRDITWSAPLYVDILHTIRDPNNENERTEIEHKRIFLARIPTMVGSSLHVSAPATSVSNTNSCEYDSKGYFIINGNEKFLPFQERLCPNKICAFQSKSRGLECVIYSQLNALTQSNALIRLYLRRNDVYVDFSHVEDTRVADMFAAIGLTDKEFILSNICNGANISADDETNLKYFTRVCLCEQRSQADANVMLETKCANWKDYFYPHDRSNAKKLLMEQFKMLLFVHFKLRDPDSRDSLKNKRIDGCGTLLTVLTAQLWSRYLRQVTDKMQMILKKNKQLRANKVVKSPYVTEGLKFALATGNFRPKEVGGKKVDKATAGKSRSGVAQALSRHNYISSVSQMRRIDSSVSHDTKIMEPRLLRTDTYGFVCPSHTPEGAACGLVSNAAIATRISVTSNPQPIIDLLDDFVSKNFDAKGKPVYVNGVYVGAVKELDSGEDAALNLASILRHHRSSRVIPFDVTIANEDTRLSIWTDSGRLIRPVFRVKNGAINIRDNVVEDLIQKRINFDDLISLGTIDFISALETEKMLIALYPKHLTDEHTHCEISPSLILGTMASTIPFADNNQSPRNTYQCAQGTQSIGMHALNFYSRMDTLSNVLNYSQKPLVTTNISEKLHISDLPSGQNAIVAVCLLNGYNQEDSILVSKGSLERGFMRATGYTSYSAADQARGQARHVWMSDGSAHIDSDGLPRVGQTLKRKETVIGRSANSRDASIKSMKNSVVVDRVFRVQNDQGGSTSKVRLREDRIIEIGDKLSSRHGQKGTIGLVVNEEDMPFTASGLRPDIIISPHCLPSRMTIGHCLEALASKVACLKGIRIDATAFDHDPVQHYEKQLHACGFQRKGSERFFDGATGKMWDGPVFFCPTYYQRLKHFSRDKVFGRALGKVSALTRQPIGGRKNAGGLRYGEMERDCTMAHGASELLRERLLVSSDMYTADVCPRCGLVGTKRKIGDALHCTACNKRVKFAKVEMPYSTKQALQEMLSMGIKASLTLKQE